MTLIHFQILSFSKVVGESEICQLASKSSSKARLVGKRYLKPWGFESVLVKFDTTGHQKHYQEDPCPPSPGWILGGQDVLDTHSVGRVSSRGAMVQISSL